MNDNDFEQKVKRIDSEIAAIYMNITSSILYLILSYKERIIAIDKYTGTNYQSRYPDTTNFSEIAILALVIANGIFLYNSYIELNDRIDRYKKTGNNTGLDASSNYFYSNVLQFASSLIVLYNVFILKDIGIDVLA